MPERRKNIFALALISIVLLVWFADVLFGGRSYYVRDLMRDHYPTKRVVREAMLSGEFPYWSPFYGGGQPLAANPAYELFYPPQWLILLPDFQLGFTLHIVVHAFIAAIGMFLLLRSFRLGASPAAFGALAFVLGGAYLSLFQLLPFLFEVTWMPLLFLFVRRWLLERRRRDFLLAVLCGGLQALVAEPTTLMQTWMLIAAYAAYRATIDKKWKQNLIGVVAMGFAAVILAAAQFIPAIDLAKHSVRARPLHFTDVVSYWSMSPGRPLELFYPSLFQSTMNANGVARIKTMYPNGSPFIANIYLGMATAILFVAGLLARKRGSVLVLAICGVSYLVAIGSNTPLLRILYEVGIFRSIRYPEKFAMAALITIVIWAAVSLDRMVKGDADIAKWSMRVCYAWFGLAALMMIMSFGIGAELGFWLRTLLRGAAVIAVLWAMQKRPSPVWAIALCAVTLLDVHYLQPELNPTITKHFFDPPPVARELDQAKSSYRIFHSADWSWAYEEPGTDVWFGTEHGPFWFIRNGMMPRTPGEWGFRLAVDADYADAYLLPTTDLIAAFRALRDSKKSGWETTFMSMSNAWYWTRFRVYADEEKRTGGNPEAMRPIDFVPAPVRTPRYYFADAVEQAGSSDMFVSKMLAKPLSPRVAFISDEAFTPAPGVVRNMRETWRSAHLEVESSGRALLVASVTPDKYWHATIDGKPAKLQVANVGYQALEVPAGKHTVELTYTNPLVIAGIAISLAALLAIAVLFAFSPAHGGEGQ